MNGNQCFIDLQRLLEGRAEDIRELECRVVRCLNNETSREEASPTVLLPDTWKLAEISQSVSIQGGHELGTLNSIVVHSLKLYKLNGSTAAVLS